MILDEAGIVSARDLDALLQKLDHEGGRLLLVGDPRQLQAVEAGTPFAQLLETESVRSARIDEIQLQSDPQLRAIAQAFADGKAGEAVVLAHPYTQTAPIEAADPTKPTTRERQAAISQATAAAYLVLSPEERARTLVLSGTNAVRRQVNEEIRAGLQQRGAVSRVQVPVTVLEKAGLTREQASWAESYAAGRVVRLDEGRGRQQTVREYTVDCVTGERVILRDATGKEKAWNLGRKQAARIYEPRTVHLAVGDVVLFRENTGRGDESITNGQVATIERVGQDGIRARLDDGRGDPDRPGQRAVPGLRLVPHHPCESGSHGGARDRHR